MGGKCAADPNRRNVKSRKPQRDPLVFSLGAPRVGFLQVRRQALYLSSYVPDPNRKTPIRAGDPIWVVYRSFNVR